MNVLRFLSAAALLVAQPALAQEAGDPIEIPATEAVPGDFSIEQLSEEDPFQVAPPARLERAVIYYVVDAPTIPLPVDEPPRMFSSVWTTTDQPYGEVEIKGVMFSLGSVKSESTSLSRRERHGADLLEVRKGRVAGLSASLRFGKGGL